MKATGTQKEILLEAEKIFSRKGLNEATIAQIASASGVSDSVIYHYFKNKEDLLFSIIGQYLEEVLEKLREQLEGILEPISRMSKMIWLHLRFNETHKDYSRLLLFECRSNPNFYQQNAYRFIQQYAGIMLSIIDDGVKQGVFDKDINSRVARDIILGALDIEAIQCLTASGGSYKTPDKNEIMTIIRSMFELLSDQTQSDQDKFSRILKAAERLFSEKGYHKSTISEIAHNANVAEGTVYEYFKNKEDLLLSIPRARLEEHIASTKELFKIESPERKLRRFIRFHFFVNTVNPHFLRVFLFHVQLNSKYYSTKAFLKFQQYRNILYKILEEGKKEGAFRTDLDIRIYSNFLFGGFSHLALRWLLLDKKKNYIDKLYEIDGFIDLLTRGAIRR